MNDDIINLTMGAIFWLVLTYGAAWISARYMPDAWYRSLDKPAWNPPDSVFGLIWSLLYFLMAVAAWLVWREAGWEGFAGPLGLYVVQLLLNSVWPWLFFSRHRPGAALLDMSGLWIAVAATMVSFWHVMPFAGMLFIPYLAWLSFAAVLNFSIWRANPRRFN
ncbi:MAG TPA: TspO/MBR family protein [Burkholderiales bacterium]|jgi:tryptophan-rich sensory protein